MAVETVSSTTTNGQVISKSSSNAELKQFTQETTDVQESFQESSRAVTTGNGPRAMDVSFSQELSVPKIRILKEKTTQVSEMVRTQLGSDAAVLLERIQSFDGFREALAIERLRHMPHDGSHWDRVLRWAESFAEECFGFHETVSGWMSNSHDAARLIWGSCLSLLHLGPSQATALTRAFGVFHRLGLAMSLLLPQLSISTATPEIRRELARAYSELMHLTCAVCIHYQTKGRRSSILGTDDFDERFGRMIEGVFSHRDRVANAMWMNEIEALQAYRDSIVDIQTLRLFLAPHDRITRKIIANRQTFGESCAEYTCEWFTSPLSGFLRNHNRVMLVTGPEGCGKTYLSSWITDRLQNIQERRQFSVISCHVDRKNINTSLGVIKALLSQTLERHIGHPGLFSQIQKAMDLSSEGVSPAEVENALWQALRLSAGRDRLVILVDGLDHLIGGQDAASSLLNRLHDLASQTQHGLVKVIALMRPLDKAAPALTQHYSIKKDNTSRDIKSFLEARFSSFHHFRSMEDKHKRAIIKGVLEKPDISFLWADLALKAFRDLKAVNSILEFLDRTNTLEALLGHHIASLNFKHGDTRHLLTWILVSERSLTVSEIRHLLEIDVSSCTRSTRFTSVEDDIYHACGSLVTIRDGIVYLRHQNIRKRLLKLVAKSCNYSPTEEFVRASHLELTLRCLGYVKLCVRAGKDVEPVFRTMDWDRIYQLFDENPLLEYSARYWSSHFETSSSFDKNGKYRIDERLKTCLPSSVLFAIIEGTCLHGRVHVERAESLQHIGYSIRRSILGESSAAVLQSLILLVKITQRSKSKKFSDFAYEAWRLSWSISRRSLSLACAEFFIESITSITISKRTEIAIRKEEALKFIMETYKDEHGISHDVTIRYTRMLADLYVEINEIDKARVLYLELYEVSIERYGYFHGETTELYAVLIKQLRALNKTEIILQLACSYHAYVTKTLTVTDERRIESTLTLVKLYEERKEVYKAEEILVELWRSVTAESHSKSCREVSIDVTLEYSRFLTRHGRKEEAEVIVRGLWTEVQSYYADERSEKIVKRVQSIAEAFRSLRVFSMARSVFKSVWSYIKKTEQSSETMVAIATALAETVTEEFEHTTTTTTTKTETTTLTAEEEETLKEVFHSTLKISSSSKSVSSSTVKTCRALATNYVKQERWSEAVEIYSKTLSQSWSFIESHKEEVEFRSEYSSEEVSIALSLAECRFKMYEVEKAELIYWNIIRSLTSGSQCDHILLWRTAKTIIEFYERTYRFEKAMEVYKKISSYFQKSIGKAHTTTIEVFYGYGVLARKLGKYTEAEHAYYHIYAAYGFEHGCCRRESISAGQILCELYERSEKWEAARNVYSCLWQTFLKRGKEYQLEVQFAQRIYKKYMHILEHKCHSEYSVIRQVAVDYRQTCISYYGASSEITMEATMHLAQICERSETYREESMSLYEEVLKYSKEVSKTSKTMTKSTSTVSSTQVETIVRKRLAKLYSSNTTTITKAETLYKEEFESCLSTYSYSSMETLSAMKSLVLTYNKQSTEESINKAVSILQTSVTEIFEKETRSEFIQESAQTIARTYLECGFKEMALTVIEELRRELIRDVRTSKEVIVERSSFAFFAAFTEVITGQPFSAILSEVKTEVLLFASYQRTVRIEKKIITIIERAVRLRQFLISSKRTREAKEIEEEVFEVFIKHFSVSVSRTIIRKFFFFCFEKVYEDNADYVIVQTAIASVREFIETGKLQEAYEMALLIDRFIHIQGGYHKQYHFKLGISLCLCLASEQTKSHRALLELSRITLREVLEGAKTADMDLAELSKHELNDICRLLGEQESYEDLERFLTELWSSRIVQRSWDPSLSIWIGRRLIETLYIRGEKLKAISLCKDIHYNLARVWGALSNTALEFTVLLSELYTSNNQVHKALELHEEVLSQLAYREDEGLIETEAPHIALQHLELLKRAHARLSGRWDGKDQSMLNLLGQRFASQDAWKEKRPVLSLDKWPASVKKDDAFGCWIKPKEFGFLVESIEDKRKRPQSVLRRTSSNWAVYGNSNGNGYGLRKEMSRELLGA